MRKVTGYPFNGMLRPLGLADPMGIQAFVFEEAIFSLGGVRS